MSKRMLSGVALALAAVLGGCSGENTGPSFAGPDIAGNWRGTWRGETVTMALQQNGNQVTGQLTAAGVTYDLSGTIDELGTFEFGASDPDPNACRSISSVIDDMAVTGQGTEMDGVMARRSVVGGCGGSRSFVEQGTFDGDKI